MFCSPEPNLPIRLLWFLDAQRNSGLKHCFSPLFCFRLLYRGSIGDSGSGSCSAGP